MNLNLPRGEQIKKQVEAHKNSQIMTLAVSIFIARLDNKNWSDNPVTQIAEVSINDARTFFGIANKNIKENE